MKFQLACADFTFPLLPHDRVLELISWLDLPGVDIGLFEGRSHLWPSKEFKNLEKSAKGLKERLERFNLEPADVFLQMDSDLEPYAINHPDSERREHARDWFLKTLDYTDVLGGKHVTTPPGVPFEQESFDSSRARAVEELVWRVEESGKRDIVFGTEAHVGSIAPTPEEAEVLVKDIPGLTLTLDYTHFTKVGISDERVEPLAKYASHFHARGATNGRLQANFNDNVIDYKRVVEVLVQAGYEGWLGLEYVWIDWEDCNKSDNLSETILYRDFFRNR
jgi:sugar phosphate isomerase/epimerase